MHEPADCIFGGSEKTIVFFEVEKFWETHGFSHWVVVMMMRSRVSWELDSLITWGAVMMGLVFYCNPKPITQGHPSLSICSAACFWITWLLMTTVSPPLCFCLRAIWCCGHHFLTRKCCSFCTWTHLLRSITSWKRHEFCTNLLFLSFPSPQNFVNICSCCCY